MDEEKTKVHGGYRTLTPTQLANISHAYLAGRTSVRGVRTIFGALVMLASREAATRTRGASRPALHVTFTEAEVAHITGLPAAVVKRELRRLVREGLLEFEPSKIHLSEESLGGSEEIRSALSGKRSPRRPIPIPRTILRFLARERRYSVIATILAYCARGLTMCRKTTDICGKGTVKASWVADVMGVSLRGVKQARSILVAAGWIQRDTHSLQRKLNRDGAYFSINLEWVGSRPSTEAAGTRESAPPAVENHAHSAPPKENKKTPNGSENQGNRSGVSTETKAGRGGGPSLLDVRAHDLEDYFRLRELHRQAVSKGLVNDSEAMLLNWVAAAVRARTCEVRDPVRVFMGIVRRGLWHHVTQADEERARVAIRRYERNAPAAPAVAALLRASA